MAWFVCLLTARMLVFCICPLQGLLAALKDVNQMIQRASKLRSTLAVEKYKRLSCTPSRDIDS